MASEPPTSAAPTNDVSISMAIAKTCFITSPDKVKEYVAKFLNCPDSSSNNTEVAKTHYGILRCITHLYPDAQVFDNFGKTMKEFPLLKTFDAYIRHFKLQFVKANPNKKHNTISLTFHNIQSSVSISKIRKNFKVPELLSKQNTRLPVHLWKEDETQITNLSLYVNVDPSHATKEYFEERIRTKVSECTRHHKKKIPKFHCSFSSPFVIEEGGTRTSTKAYDLQCRQSDAKDIITLLQEPYKTDPQFVFHQIRHHDLTAYKNAICKQNLFLAKSCIVLIKGVTMDAMFYVSNEISQIRGVIDTFPHKDLASHGQWDIMTDTTHFKPVIPALETNLAAWTCFYCNWENITLGTLPAPSLAFTTQPYEDHSDATFSTYMSAFTNMYALQDDSCDQPPQFNGPSPQSWSPPSTVSYATTLSTRDTSPS